MGFPFFFRFIAAEVVSCVLKTEKFPLLERGGGSCDLATENAAPDLRPDQHWWHGHAKLEIRRVSMLHGQMLSPHTCGTCQTRQAPFLRLIRTASRAGGTTAVGHGRGTEAREVGMGKNDVAYPQVGVSKQRSFKTKKRLSASLITA